jgi:hypothetical protein
MPRWSDYEDSVADVERSERRAAQQDDPTHYRRVGDRWMDENDVPDLSDVAE